MKYEYKTYININNLSPDNCPKRFSTFCVIHREDEPYYPVCECKRIGDENCPMNPCKEE
jgi:hypothetical protein